MLLLVSVLLFTSVFHAWLLFVLSAMGIPWWLLLLFRHLYAGGYAIVAYKGKRYGHIAINRGVRQGCLPVAHFSP